MSMMQTGSLELDSDQASSIINGDTSTFTSVDFPTPFPQGSQVIVIPMVQTFNGCDSPGIRIADVTTTGFKIRMNEIVYKSNRDEFKLDGKHTSETIGWLAYTV